ncbi:MAG: 3-isopropylmalate dehydratase small subunit [Pseudomonadota bacterium]
MDAFTLHTGIAVPLDIPNCDTDQIIPARFLRKPVDDPQYPRFFLADLRFDTDGSEKDFILNEAPFRNASVIVADRNWGCGSSRENAVTAMLKNNVAVVIAPSFGDIHYNNCVKRGLLPVRLSAEECAELRDYLKRNPGTQLTADLDDQVVSGAGNLSYRFEISSSDKQRLLTGLDDVDLTLRYQGDIEAFEKRRETEFDWLS